MPSLIPESHPARQIMTFVEAAGKDIRLVGGAVRDYLLGKPLSDIDLATTAEPDCLTDILQQKGVKIIPTGRIFGTVTALYQNKTVEITSLRRDIGTDGRHARVLFTQSFEEDSKRRDLTINALYADKNGQIFDYHNGQQDLKTRILRFVGEPSLRVREDYLRILRLFRFMAMLEGFQAEPLSLEVCIENAASMEKLSGERIWAECKKLLVAPAASEALEAIQRGEIARHIAPGFIMTDERQKAFHKLASREAEMAKVEEDAQENAQGHEVRRLSLFCTNPDEMAKRLKLSREEAKRLKLLCACGENDETKKLPRLLYEQGVGLTIDRLLLDDRFDDAARQKQIDEAQKWSRPSFPLGKNDWQTYGLEEGRALGQMREKMEEWWIDQDFPSRESCLEALKNFIEEQRNT